VENFPQPKEGSGKTRDGIAKTIGLGSGRQWDKLEYVAKHKPELLSEIKPDGITIHKAYIKTYRDEIKRKVKKMEWPTGKYRVIYADPPWQYSNNQPDYFTTQDDHYPTMSINEICALPVSKLALDNAVLFLWVTSPILEDSFKVIDAWGFKYKASFIWDKVKHNMGHYNSIRHEFLLVAVRGSCPPDTPELYDSVQSAERTDHSAKPELFRQIIDTLYPYGPRIELFARRKAKGWEQYGNQIS
jgi:N6-adenosine-specific RNA methylase IME4